MGITDHECDRAMGPDMVLVSSQGSDIIMAPESSAGHPHWHGLHRSVTLGYQHGPQQQPGLAFALPSMLPGATDINIDPGCERFMNLDVALGSSPGPDDTMDITDPVCGRTTDPDMIPCSSPGLDVIMAPGGSTAHPDWQGPQSRVAFRHTHMAPGCGPDPWLQHDLQWYQESWIFTQTHPGCSRAMDSDTSLVTALARV